MSDNLDVRWHGKKVIQDPSNRLVTDNQIETWDEKANKEHTHLVKDITDFPKSLPASDVKDWAKADTKPSYAWNEINNKPTEYKPSAHKHLKSDITDFPESLKNPLSITVMLNNGKTEGTDLFTYDGSIAKTININYANIGAAPLEHYHDDRYYTETEVNNLLKNTSSGIYENLTWENILNKPSTFVPVNHTHVKAEITDFPTTMKNPFGISIKFKGGSIEGDNMFTYDGSKSQVVDIYPEDIGASSIGHTHEIKEIKDFPVSMPASDVYDWAKEKTKPSYVWNEIGEKPTEYTPVAHKHVVKDITDFPTSMKNPNSISIRFNGGDTEGLDMFTYNGTEQKALNITPIKIGAADRSHTHTKSQITDFPTTMKNPTAVTLKFDNMATKSSTSDSYDGSTAKTFTVASNTHKHNKEDILDFPESIKNPSYITIILDDGKTTTQESYDGSAPKTFNVAAAKHVHDRSEFVDFPDSIKNPNPIIITMNDGEDITEESYDGSETKTFDLAKGKHVHIKSEITDFPDSIKNPTYITLVLEDGKTTTRDSYDGSAGKTFNVAASKHVHTKSEITDFPTSIKNPTSIIITMDDGNEVTRDTYDGSAEKTFDLAKGKHVHTKSEITDFPDSIKNPTSITIITNNGKGISKDTYDGSAAKTFNVAADKHVHTKSEITDFPVSIKNPSSITIQMNDGTKITEDSYDGSTPKTFDVAKGKHVHVKNEITDFPASIKNPNSVTLVMNDGKTTTQDSYDGSDPKTFNVAASKHVHTKSEITDFPVSIKNPTSIILETNDGKTITKDSYDGSKEKTFSVAKGTHVHTKSEITDFPVSIKNPNTITIVMHDGNNQTTQDSYDGSAAKTFNVANAKHVHNKSEITDFPVSIKNPTAITISLNNGKDTVTDSYDGSAAKSFNAASAKHVHTTSEITDFPTSFKNPSSIIIRMNDGTKITEDSYDGSAEKTFDVAKGTHTHTRNDITNFPTSIKNPESLDLNLYNGKATTTESYDGSSPKSLDVATAKHVHTKSEITDFPVSIKNPNSVTFNMSDGKTTTSDSYDGSTAKTFDFAKASHVHTKSQITDFPESIKNPNAIIINLNDGKTNTSDSYDGSVAKSFSAAAAKHVHVKSEITDFPASIKNPTSIIIKLNGGATEGTNMFTYDGSTAKSINITPSGVGAAPSVHTHTKSQITDFPASIKNPTNITIKLNGGTTEGTNQFTYDGSSAKTINITPAGIGASANTHLHDDRYYTESEIDAKLSTINTTMTSHNHTKLQGVASSATVPGKSDDGFMTYHYNVNTGLANNMPSSNNANAILTISRHGGDFTTQLGFSSNDNIYYRNGVGTTAWKRLLDSSNYNDYAPTKTGTGASGTWGISISGKAATAGTADSANSVAWGKVTGKPSTYTPSTHTHTKSQITDFPASIKNPTSIIIKLNGGTTEGTNQFTYDGSAAKTINITPAGIGASASGHTHSYAGSVSSGGSANSAVKLDTTTAGSATQPVYFTGGKPVACTYTLGKSVPSNAVFTDTNTWRGIQNNLTSDSTSDSLSAAQGKVLKGLVDGKAASGHTHNFVVGSYTGNGGQQKPNYFGTNKVGFLMMNTTVNGNSQYKDWIILDCYYGTDVGGGVAIGVNRQSLGAYIMRSAATRDAWAESAELLHTANYTSYTVTKTGSGASGTWGISISGKAATAGTADSANAVAWGNVSGKPSTFTPSTHTHTKSQITDFPSSLKNPKSLSIQLNGGTTEGTNQFTYDGSAAKTISITPSGIGAAASSHTHTIANITNLQTTLDGKASTSHTHNYAGSSSAGGSATSAVKLDTTTAGSATQPVYFTGGKPTACTYTLGKSVPSNAVFTDTNTWRPLGTTADTACAGNDSRLSNSRPASDVYAWAKASTKPSYSWSEIGSKPSTFTPSSHTHAISDITNLQSTLNGKLSIKGGTLNNGSTQCPLIITGAANNESSITFKYKTQTSGGHWVIGQGCGTADLNSFAFYQNGKGVIARLNNDGQWRCSRLVLSGSVAKDNLELSDKVYANDYTIRFKGGTDPYFIFKGPSSLNFGTDSDTTIEGNQANHSFKYTFRMQINYCYCDVGFRSYGVATTTVSSASNVRIDPSSFIFQRVSSASKYKLDIQDINEADTYPYNILKVNPKQWFDKGETERYSEYLTAIYNNKELTDEQEVKLTTGSLDSYYGLIAEDLEAAGLSKFCDYAVDKDGKKEIEGIQYDRLAVLMIPILRDLVNYVKETSSYVKDHITDKDVLERVTDLERKFSSFSNDDIIRKQYDIENK